MKRRDALMAALATAAGAGTLFGTTSARAALSGTADADQAAPGSGAAAVASTDVGADVGADAAASAATRQLRAGQVAVLLRHAHTEPGIGDPPGFKRSDCTTQRNLDATGRAQAAAIGAWFRARQLEPSQVRSSHWCRCLDTATLAFGQVEPWQALDSIFRGTPQGAGTADELRQVLLTVAPKTFDIWVTHQVNIIALTGEDIRMGEAFIVKPAKPGAGVALDVIARWQPGG